MSVNMSHSNSNPNMLLHFKCESIVIRQNKR